jgi:predicted TIM-barrel fold metal-dependent hydrolase
MPAVIDADTHVIESEPIWDFFDEEMKHRKPALVPYRDPIAKNLRTFWVIDGALVPKPLGRGGQLLATPPIEEKERTARNWRVRELSDLESRLEDADQMGVDVQVIYPTIFIAYLTDDVAMEVALSRSYNRFMADVWSKGKDRLRWVVVPPLRDIDKTIEELHFGKEHGAVGVLFRGIEKDRSLADPYFFPVYEEASKLDMPICVHTGPGCPAFTEVIDTRYSSVLPAVRMLPIMACYDILANNIPQKFPDLRIGFIEANSSWVPYIFHFMNRRTKSGRGAWGPHTFKENRLFVACEADEDLPYLLEQVGEDNMISGSDYGHQDQSTEPDLVHVLRAREDVSKSVMDKILCDNPARFYAL